VALRLPRVSRLGTSAYKPILAFLILTVSSSTTDHLCYHPSLSLLSRHILAFSYARSPCISPSPCLYPYPMTSIQITTAQRGRLEVYGVIPSHLRIFATSHADLFLPSYHLVAIFPSSRQTCPFNSIERLAQSHIIPSLHISSRIHSPHVQVNRKRIVIGILFATPCDPLRDGLFITPSRLVSSEPCAHHELCPAAPQTVNQQRNATSRIS